MLSEYDCGGLLNTLGVLTNGPNVAVVYAIGKRRSALEFEICCVSDYYADRVKCTPAMT